MANIKELDWSVASDDLKEMTFRLINESPFLPDLLRNMDTLSTAINDTFSRSQTPYGMYGKNGLGGFFYVTDVVPEHDASFYCWVWDRSAFSHRAVRAIREYIEKAAREYLLRRMTARAAEKNLCHLLEHIGFKSEGRFRFGYKTHGKLMTLIQYRAIINKDGIITGD